MILAPAGLASHLLVQRIASAMKKLRDGPFNIKIKNYLNPWLYSYGVGMRTVMLGYYMKFDLAWPVENYEVR